MVRVGVAREIAPGEARVALIPETVAKLAQSGFEVLVEAGAGQASGFQDTGYASAGAAVLADVRDLYARADVVVKVREPLPSPTGGHEADLFHAGSVLIGFLNPARNTALIEQLAAAGVTAFAM